MLSIFIQFVVYQQNRRIDFKIVTTGYCLIRKIIWCRYVKRFNSWGMRWKCFFFRTYVFPTLSLKINFSNEFSRSFIFSRNGQFNPPAKYLIIFNHPWRLLNQKQAANFIIRYSLDVNSCFSTVQTLSNWREVS